MRKKGNRVIETKILLLLFLLLLLLLLMLFWFGVFFCFVFFFWIDFNCSLLDLLFADTDPCSSVFNLLPEIYYFCFVFQIVFNCQLRSSCLQAFNLLVICLSSLPM